ncbi:MAG: hypothetical protein GVY22_00560 [Gammaproteobacteria bacterium]|jgi:hypothetical protein|nr:hypothetical protein [Gammaproteobacteria bacterium]
MGSLLAGQLGGSERSWVRVDPGLYRKPVVWGVGGVLVACLFVALARIIHDLNRLVAAAVRGQSEDRGRAED